MSEIEEIPQQKKRLRGRRAKAVLVLVCLVLFGPFVIGVNYWFPRYDGALGIGVWVLVFALQIINAKQRTQSR